MASNVTTFSDIANVFSSQNVPIFLVSQAQSTVTSETWRTRSAFLVIHCGRCALTPRPNVAIITESQTVLLPTGNHGNLPFRERLDQTRFVVVTESSLSGGNDPFTCEHR
jgi:hypothetical protein